MSQGMTASADPEGNMSIVATPSERPLLRAPGIRREGRVLVELGRSRATCSGCTLRDLCLAEGLDADALSEVDHVIAGRTRLRKGDTLFRAGERFVSLYAIRSGSCKTVSLTDDGQDQVAGYHMPGEI